MAGRSVHDILDDLDLSKGERASVIKEALRRHDRIGGNPLFRVFRWILAPLFFGYLVSSNGHRVLMPLIPMSPPALGEMSRLALFLIGAIVPVMLLRYGLVRACKPHLLQILFEQGHRYCFSCEYALRDLPCGTTRCPECSAHLNDIAPITSHHLKVPAIRIDHQLLGVRGVPEDLAIDPAAVERAHLNANPHYRHDLDKNQALLWALVLIAFMMSDKLTLFGLEYLTPLDPELLRRIVWTALALSFTGMALWYIRRKYRRLFRVCLRMEGFEVCRRCGQYLGDEAEGVTTCCGCGRPRIPMLAHPD